MRWWIRWRYVVARAASPQFVQPIFFRLIRVHADWITYDAWIWLDGYQLDDRGDAVARRSIFVQKAGLRVLAPSALAPTPADRRARRSRQPAPRRSAPLAGS
ncbi:hypothetical protein OG559_21040 [Micromonospora sp. NBC_01405]|uniref:hypothetical protein n=1 Tax=Micromonospora sp. NBC_01405 TaxID=2903589 RepID=UPI003246D64C